MVWGKIKEKWAHPTAVLYGIVTFAVVLYIFNQIGWEPTTKVKIHRWLDEISYGVRNMSDKTSDFHFEVTDHTNTLFYIRQAKDNSFVVFELGYDVEVSFPNVKTLDRKSHERLVRHLRSEMGKQGLNYANFGYPLTKVRISFAAPSSSLTRENFFEAILRMRAGRIILVEEIGQVAS